MLTVLMAVIILLETNWHNLSTLTEWEDQKFKQRCKKKMDKKKDAIKACY